MLSAYPACFFKEENGYSVIFPDLSYLATCGDDLNDAFAMAVDCLAGYLYESKFSHEEIPAPSSIQEVRIEDVVKELGGDYSDCDYSDAFVNMVTVDVEEYAKLHFNKAVKKTLSIPEWLNNAAKDAGINFSQVLQEALIQKLSAR